ncbi:MAG: hypothetical protein MUC49_09135 [Raineya sp.]|jgi:hypothetical protein|nr:hypothetical protein [Raineya sp.]
MKKYLILALFGITGISKGQNMNSCYTEENFEIAYHYVQWKKQTSKKLSENHKVLLEDGYELEALEQDGMPKIVFSKKNYSYFFVSNKNGITPLTKSASDLKKYEEKFCKLMEVAKFKNLPKNYTYRYIDGVGNAWIISDKDIEYKPITKEMSSSGMYDGGTPFKKEITETQFKEIQSLLKKGLQNKEIETDSRRKGTGVIEEAVTPTVTVVSKIILMDAKEKQAIEAWLNAQKP